MKIHPNRHARFSTQFHQHGSDRWFPLRSPWRAARRLGVTVGIGIFLTACATSAPPPEAAGPGPTPEQSNEPQVRALPPIQQGDGTCASLRDCAVLVQHKIRRQWVVPRNIPHYLSASLSVRFGDQGQVTEIRFVETSGNPSFDESIRSAVLSAAPFPELDGLSNDERRAFEQVRFRFQPGG